ncbi:AbrB/MazE/SpoVT family DNA-binding domain-containing protein [Lacrimispora aerotolerans]|uniref:AbrB/MazE/SpoVT family DNA-binding domain-containing protein n=1 Tax=Lacrimispora aerotolerans TaxID=36832 RepID=UPI00047E7438|nr:AbrB/MazE/SpoVT family DNA-binding domain-containing protein [Lacrimispora aerotolerans]
MNEPKGKFAWTVKVGEKGQFVIPKEARDIFDIKPGDTLILLGDEKRGIAIPPKSDFMKYAAKIFGGTSFDEEGPV